MASLCFEIDSSASELLDQAAAARDCSREDAAAGILAQALQEERELMEAAQEGFDDFAAGRWITHEQMIEHLEERRRKQAAA